MRRGLAVLLGISLTVAVAAQDSACPALQAEALANIVSGCAEQASSTFCVSHPTVSVIKRPPNLDPSARQQPGIRFRSTALTGWP